MSQIGFATGVTTPPAGSSAEIRTDGWVNVLTGWGMANKDKRVSGTFSMAVRLDQITLDELYRGDGIAAKIVDTLPNDMFRKGVEIKIGDDAKLPKVIQQAMHDLKVMTTLREGMRWGRLYGGALVILGIDDGQEQDRPLNENQIRAIRFLTVLDRHQLQVRQRYTDLKHPKFGQPELYDIQAVGVGTLAGQNVTVHESRVIRFGGTPIPERARQENDGWDDPVLTRVFNAVRGYANAHDSVQMILQDFSQGILKLKGLTNKLTANDDQAILKRLQAIELGRSILRSLVLDDGDEFDRKSTPVTGLEKLVDAAERRLCAEVGMPHTLLLGESPGASLGEGGKSETQDWYDFVSSQQGELLRDPLTRVITLLMKSKDGPTSGKVPDGWELCFPSLWQLDDKEQGEVRLNQAKTDEIYVKNGVLSPEEVAVSRFGSGAWSAETVLDTKLRKEIDDAREPPDDENPDEMP